MRCARINCYRTHEVFDSRVQLPVCIEENAFPLDFSGFPNVKQILKTKRFDSYFIQ